MARKVGEYTLNPDIYTVVGIEFRFRRRFRRKLSFERHDMRLFLSTVQAFRYASVIKKATMESLRKLDRDRNSR